MSNEVMLIVGCLIFVLLLSAVAVSIYEFSKLSDDS